MTRPRFVLRILTLALLLFSAQLSVAVHSVEHPFHKHIASCDAFMSAQHEQALHTHIAVPEVLPQTVEIFAAPAYFYLSLTNTVYTARAPPLFA